MSYRIEISDIALKQLKKLDPSRRIQILKYLSKVLAKLDDPRIIGKALKGNLGEFWRYRTGNFRILCRIEDKKLLVIILKIAHRKEIYE